MDFELSDEQRLIRSEIQDLCDQFGDEYWREKDMQHEFGWEFYEEFADGGWCGVTIPEEYGGQGYVRRSGGEHHPAGDRPLRRCDGRHVDHVTPRLQRRPPVVEYGSDDHKERYLPDIADGAVMVCTGVTEPNAGTDTSQIETFAERDGDEYVVNGQKIWTSKAQEADVIMLLARTQPRESSDRFGGLTLLLFHRVQQGHGQRRRERDPKGRPRRGGLERGLVRRLPRSGRRSNRRGRKRVQKYLLSFANSERISIAANAVGTGQAALETAASYARERAKSSTTPSAAIRQFSIRSRTRGPN